MTGFLYCTELSFIRPSNDLKTKFIYSAD